MTSSPSETLNEPKIDRTLLTRLGLGSLLIALTAIPFAIDFATGNDVGLLIGILLLATLGFTEFRGLARRAGAAPYDTIGYVLGTLLVLLQWIGTSETFAGVGFPALPLPAILVLILFVPLLGLNPSGGKGTDIPAMHRTGSTILGVLYIYGCLGCLLLLRGLPYGDGANAGIWMVIATLACVKGADSGAYLIGRKFGRRKLAPSVSPGKTVEGFVGGILVAAGIAVAIPTPPWWTHGIHGPILFGALCGLIGQVGDLAESKLKRDADVKDSGNLLPAFGGTLDLLDSVLFAAPAAYVLAATILSGGVVR